MLQIRNSYFVYYINLCYEKIYQGKDTKASENGRKAENEANLEFLNNDGHFVPSARADSEPYM